MPDEVVPPEERPEEEVDAGEEEKRALSQDDGGGRRRGEGRERQGNRERGQEIDPETLRRFVEQERKKQEQKEKITKVPKGLEDVSKYLWSRYLGKAKKTDEGLTDEELARAEIEFPPEEAVDSGAVILHMIDNLDYSNLKEQLEKGILRDYILGSEMFVNSVRDVKVENRPSGYEEKLKELLYSAKDLESLRSGVRSLVKPLIKGVDEARRKERSLSAPESVQELALDIMHITGGEFGREGKYALLKFVDGKEVFQQKNFLRWVRNRMVYFHKADPDNPNINLNAQVSIFGAFRDIAIQQMIDNPAFFTDQNTGEYYEGLRDQVIYELWLYGTSRSIDALYRQQMGSDVELPKILSQIYQSNAFTKQGTLDRILSLMNTDEDKKIKFGDKEATNQDTGQALRRALLTYYYLSDEEMLHKIENDGVNEGKARKVMFNNKAFVESYVEAKLNAWADSMNKSLDDLKKEKKNDYDKKFEEFTVEGKRMVVLSDFYMEDGKKALNPQDWLDKRIVSEEILQLVAEQKRKYIKAKNSDKFKGDEEYMKEEFKEHLNVFNAQEKDIRATNETKERIKLFILEKTGLSYSEADYAEVFAYSMTRWTGIGALNDTGSIGFDAWTKVLDTQGYRERQALITRAGVNGNPYSFAGFKRLGASYLHAVDKSGKSIIEWIQGGQGEDVNLETTIQGMTFGERAMQAYAANHINRTFNLFTSIIDSKEFNFDQFVKIDNFGRVIFDPTKAGEVIDGTFKDIRYAYCTWSDLDYSKLVRVRTKEWDFEKKELVPVFKTVTVAEMLWGDQVLETMAKKARKEEAFIDASGKEVKREQTIGEVLQESNNRRVIWKEVLKYAIAAEIYAHRDLDSPYRRFTPAEVEKIFEFLERYNFDIAANPFDFKENKRKEATFLRQDTDWIRQASSTGKVKMIGEEVVWGKEGGAWGLLGGIMKAAQLALSNASKAA